MESLKVGLRPARKKEEKEVLRNLQLLLIFKGGTACELSFAILLPFYQYYGLSTAEIFTLLGGGIGVGLVAEVPSGWFADRYGRKQSILVGAVFLIASYVTFGFVRGFWPVFLAISLLMIGGCFIGGVDRALAYDSLKRIGWEKEYSARYETRIYTYVAGGGITAALAGSWIAASGGMYLIAWIQTIVYVLLFCVGLCIREIRPSCASASHGQPRVSVRTVLKYALHEHGELKWLIFYLATILLGVTTLVNLRPVYFQLVGIPIEQFGTLHVIQLACLAVVARLAHQYAKLGRKNVLWSFCILLVSGCVLLALVQSVWPIAFLIFVITIPEAIAPPILNQHINQLVGSGVRATALSISPMVLKLGYCVTSPFFGWVIGAYSLSTAFWLAAVLLGGLCVLVLLGMGRHH